MHLSNDAVARTVVGLECLASWPPPTDAFHGSSSVSTPGPPLPLVKGGGPGVETLLELFFIPIVAMS